MKVKHNTKTAHYCNKQLSPTKDFGGAHKVARVDSISAPWRWFAAAARTDGGAAGTKAAPTDTHACLSISPL